MHALNPEHIKSIEHYSNDHTDTIDITLRMPRPSHVPKPPQLVGCPKNGFHFSFLDDDPPCPDCSKYHQEKEAWKKEALKALSKPDVFTTLEVTGYSEDEILENAPIGVNLSVQASSGEPLVVVLPRKFYGVFQRVLKGVEMPQESPRDLTRLDRLLNDESL